MDTRFLLGLCLSSLMIACSSAQGGITSDDNDTGTVVDNDSETTDDGATTSADSSTPPSDSSTTPPKDTGTTTDTGTAVDTSPPPIPGAVYGAKCATMSADDVKAWEDIAIVRGKAKMGALNCYDGIQKGSNNHANYMQLNGGLTHNETSGKPGFTGVNFWDRMKAGGFTGPGSAMFEVIHSLGDGHGSILGESGWINTLYHRIPFVSYGAGGYGFGNNSGKWATIDFSSGGATPGATAISTWPVDGDTGVWTTFRCASEIPNPLPGQTNAGYPVSITGAKTLVISSQQILKAGADVPLVMLTKATDGAGLIPDTQVYMIPKAPLTPSTKYDVKVKGTVGGAPFDLAFSFTTGTK